MHHRDKIRAAAVHTVRVADNADWRFLRLETGDGLFGFGGSSWMTATKALSRQFDAVVRTTVGRSASR